MPTVNFGESILGYTAQMRRTYLVVIMSALYIALLVVGLLFPRKTPVEQSSGGFLKTIFHEILFLSGPLEVFLNFLLFVPFFLAICYLLPELRRSTSAIASCVASAAAELAQSQIVGRVSSWRDFISNSVGVLIVFIAFTAISKRKVSNDVLLS